MKLNFKDTILIFIILSIFIGDLLIYAGILNLFFKDTETIWAGIIAFIGAILGGAITYYGVRLQIRHREKEIFMSTATETLININQMINCLKPIYSNLYQLDFNSDNELTKANEIRKNIKKFNEVLIEHTNIIYKYIDYDIAQEIRYYLKFFPPNFAYLDYQEMYREVEKCKNLYNNLLYEEIKVERIYRKYKIAK
ncbi:hypothetical protein ABFY55_14575 [Bacillus altitudinis]|uniref:hypothetical protein n=1 Tax=Bacillus altitudinis TaxID=293387 RepID=UPI003D254E7C